MFAMTAVIVVYAEDFQVSSKTSTNLTAKACRRTDVYTRDGERLLLTEKITSLDGLVWTLEQTIVWRGEKAAKFSTLALKAGKTFGVHFYAVPGVDAVASWTETGALYGVSLVGSNDEIRLGFIAKDGILSPMSTNDVERANSAQRDLQGMFGRYIRTETTSKQFLKEVDKFQTKYGTNVEHN